MHANQNQPQFKAANRLLPRRLPLWLLSLLLVFCLTVSLLCFEWQLFNSSLDKSEITEVIPATNKYMKLQDLNASADETTQWLKITCAEAKRRFQIDKRGECFEYLRYGERNAFSGMWHDSMSERRSDLRQKLASLKEPIVVTVLNAGFAVLLLNWLCGAVAHDILEVAKAHTLVVVSDEKAYNLVKDSGLQVHRAFEWLKLDISEQRPSQWWLGAHKDLVSLQIALTADIVQMGHSVLLQDADVVWIRDPMAYLRLHTTDIQMSIDWRMDASGPGNSGFLLIQSNWRTTVFMEAMVNLMHAVYSGRSDQRLWNTLLEEKLFREVGFKLMDERYAVGGYQTQCLATADIFDCDFSYSAVKYNNETAIVYHPNFTADIFDKLEKLVSIGLWFFDDKCPFFQKELLPKKPTKRQVTGLQTAERNRLQMKALKKMGLIQQ